MPFEPFDPPLVPKSLADLAHVLRNRRLWPPGFEWDFADGKTCARGLHERLTGGISVIEYFRRDSYGVDNNWVIFGRGSHVAHSITPERVAARIDAYLAGQPIPY